MLKIGDFVTRKSYNNDLLFVIVDIVSDVAYLKGINVRLYADSYLDDLVLVDDVVDDSFSVSDRKEALKIKDMVTLNRNEYFYLPGKILQIDGDRDYLKRCIDFYKELHLEAYGVSLDEDEFDKKIIDCLEEYKPDILVITGHDSLKKIKIKIR